MTNHRPLFGTIFVGLLAMLVGGGALLSAFGHNLFFEARFSFAWIVVGLLVVSACLLLMAAFWPRKENERIDRAEIGQPAGGGGHAAFGMPVDAIERRFVPVTDADARQGASSEGGNVLADLRWLEPNREKVSVPLHAEEGSIDLLVNADSSLAIHMTMGTGTVSVDPSLGLHPAGRAAVGGTLPSDVHLLLGRHVTEAGDATLVVNVDSVSADLRIAAM